MKLMGLVDLGSESITEFTDFESQWQCPVTDGVIERIRMASGHMFFQNLQKEGHNDGYVHMDNLPNVVGSEAQNVAQCDCYAHRFLLDSTSEAECEDMKTLIRSSQNLTAESGCEYACALLRLLFTHMKLLVFKPVRSGQDHEVSYVLLCEKKKYRFRGCPDFVVYKDDVGAGRILVATGEIQSTSNSAVQNAIYAVGSLLRNYEAKPMLCITILKDKVAQLAVARLQESDFKHDDKLVVGEVSLRYVSSPSPMDLKKKKGIMDLATRLFYMLK